MIELICVDSTGCSELTNGLIHKVRLHGDYVRYMNRDYRRTRFKRVKPYHVKGLGLVTREWLNEANNMANRRLT